MLDPEDLILEVDVTLTKAARYHARILGSTNPTAYRYRTLEQLEVVVKWCRMYPGLEDFVKRIEATMLKHRKTMAPQAIRTHKQEHVQVGMEIEMSIQEWDYLMRQGGLKKQKATFKPMEPLPPAPLTPSQLLEKAMPTATPVVNPLPRTPEEEEAEVNRMIEEEHAEKEREKEQWRKQAEAKQPPLA